MDHINASVIAFAFLTAVLSTSSLADLPGTGVSKGEPSIPKKIAFHVIGMKKAKSGAT